MKDPADLRIQNQFGGFCTKVLKNEAAKIHNEYAKQRSLEKSFEELTSDELSQIVTFNKPFEDEHIFNVLGKPVVVTGNIIAEAIANLPEDKRDVILLAYFLGLNDREISEHLKVVRQTISKRRARSLKELRNYLEKEGFEWTEP